MCRWSSQKTLSIEMTIEKAKALLYDYFAEACNILGVNHEENVFKYEHIGQRFKTVENTCEVSGNILYINEDWIAYVLQEDFLYDLQYQMYHEARHFYQRMVINDYHVRGKCSELPATIMRWEAERRNYIRNEGTEETQKANAKQQIEIDANAFACVLLMRKGQAAKSPEEQMQETMKRAKVIYTELSKLGRI